MDYDVSGLDKVLGTLVSASKTAAIAVFANQLPPANLKDLVGRIHGAAAADRRAEQRPRRGAQPRLRPRGRRRRDAVGDPGVRATSAASRRGRRSTSGAWSASSTGRWRDEPLRVFAVAPALVALVHAFDDAFVHRGPGLGLGQHALAGLIALAAGIGGDRRLPARCGPGLQAGARVLVRRARARQRRAARRPHRRRRARRRRRDRRARGRRRRRADRARGRDPVAASRRRQLAARAPWRRARRRCWRRRSCSARWPWASSTHAQVARAGRRRRRAPPTRTVSVRGLGRARARRLVPPVAERRRGRRRARRQQRPQGLGRPRVGCSPATATASCSTTPAAAARARAARTTTAGTGARTSPARSTSSSARDDVDPSRIGAVGLSTGADALIDVARGAPRRRRRW